MLERLRQMEEESEQLRLMQSELEIAASTGSAGSGGAGSAPAATSTAPPSSTASSLAAQTAAGTPTIR